MVCSVEQQGCGCHPQREHSLGGGGWGAAGNKVAQEGSLKGLFSGSDSGGKKELAKGTGGVCAPGRIRNSFRLSEAS